MTTSTQMRYTPWLVAMTAVLALAAAPLTVVQAQNSQQAKMTSCNADAKTKGLSGADRKTFMKSCLSKSAPASTHLNSQQQKMKDCNAQATAKSLKGTERKSFMSTCLKGSGSATP